MANGSCNICLCSTIRLLNLSADNKFRETYQLVQILANPQHKLEVSLWVCSTCWLILRKISEFQQKLYKSQKTLAAESHHSGEAVNINPPVSKPFCDKKPVEDEKIEVATQLKDTGVIPRCDVDDSQATCSTDYKSECDPFQFLNATLDDQVVAVDPKHIKYDVNDISYDNSQNDDISHSSNTDAENDNEMILSGNVPSSSTAESNVKTSRSNPRVLKKLYKCRHCKIFYKDKTLLTTHKCEKLPKSTKSETRKCPFCASVFKNIREYIVHIRSHPDEVKFKCKYCDKVMLSKSQLVDHERVHTGEKPHVCQFCGRGFRQQSTLNVHMKLHTGPPNPCKLCDKRFCREVDLQHHVQRVHLGQRPEKHLLCPTCGYATHDRYSLNRHMETHSDERKFDCKQCSKSFKAQVFLKRHMVTHSYDKPHQCTVCSYRCKRKENLKTHMKRHVNEADRLANKNGEQLYTCEYCSKSFDLQEALLEHIRTFHAKLD